MSVDEKAKALSVLRTAHENLRKASDEVVQAVVDARHVNATWQGIADELGIAQPNAIRKYKPLLGERTPRNRWEQEADQATPALVAVRHAVKAHKKAESDEVHAVAGARSKDVTWDAIAEVVGMKQPNAVAKYRPLLEEKRTVTVRKDVSET